MATLKAIAEVDTPATKELGSSSSSQRPSASKSSEYGLEILCGVTVSLAQVPEAVAFSLAAGLPPSVGLNSAWIVGIVTALLGGRPAMICGATGALAVVVGGLVESHGVEYLFYAVILMGLIQMLLGMLNVGALLILIPAPVMIGFCNGLALVIGFAQIANYKLPSDGVIAHRRLSGAFGSLTDGVPFISGTEAVYAAIITVVALTITLFLPRLTKKVPSALVAIVLSTAIEWFIIRQMLNGQTKTVGDIASAGGNFPIPVWFDSRYQMPPFNLDTFIAVLPLAVTMSAIGLLESLMTLNLIDDITKSKSSTLRECLGQGSANLLCGALGGMGGCAMIGQSMININAGARTRISSLCAGLFLLLIVLVGYPAIDIIPVSALVGVMLNVCICTFEWSSLKLIMIAAMPARMRDRCLTSEKGQRKIRRTDAALIIIVTIVTLLSDLAIAVACGVLLSCVMFAYESASLISADAREITDPETGKLVKLYDIKGVLFFGSSTQFLELFHEEKDPEEVMLVFEDAFISDYTAIDALNKLGERYGALGKSITLHQLQPNCNKLVAKAAGLLVKEVAMEAGEPLPSEPHHFNRYSDASPVTDSSHRAAIPGDDSTDSSSDSSDDGKQLRR